MTVVEEARGAPEPTPVRIGGVRAGPGRSVVLRRDRWRLQPAATALGLLAFVGYSTWAAFVTADYYAGNVGRDLICAVLLAVPHANCHGYVWGPITGSWWNVSPALLILIFPLGFRLTCYYYRKAYYRSFWLAPPACAVSDATTVAAATPARPGSRSSCRTSTATSSTSACSSTRSSPSTPSSPSASPAGHRAQRRHASSVRQRRPAVALLARLPRLPPPLRRAGASTSPSTRPLQVLEERLRR